MLEQRGQVVGCQMRFPKEHDDDRLRVTLSYFRNLAGGVAVARGDAAHICARHAIQPVNRSRMSASTVQQLAIGLPIVAPVQVETNALAQLVIGDAAGHPFVECLLVTRKYRLQRDHYRPAGARDRFEHAAGIALRCRQGMIVTEQQDVGRTQGLVKFGCGEHAFVADAPELLQ